MTVAALFNVFSKYFGASEKAMSPGCTLWISLMPVADKASSPMIRAPNFSAISLTEMGCGKIIYSNLIGKKNENLCRCLFLPQNHITYVIPFSFFHDFGGICCRLEPAVIPKYTLGRNEGLLGSHP
jgi:hypothetical protein